MDEDEALEMIADCEDRESQLTEWEADFLESISDYIDNGNRLSEKQIEALTSIWGRVTKRG